MFDLFEPGDTSAYVGVPFWLEQLDVEDVFDYIDCHVDVMWVYESLILNFFEDEVQSVVAILAAVLVLLEERGEEGLLATVIEDRVDGKVLQQDQCLLAVDVVLQDLAVHHIQGV